MATGALEILVFVFIICDNLKSIGPTHLGMITSFCFRLSSVMLSCLYERIPFFMMALSAINLPLSTTLFVSHNLGYAVYSFYLNSRMSYFFLNFYLDPFLFHSLLN